MINTVGDWLGRRAIHTPFREALVVMPRAQRAGLGDPQAEPLRLTYDQWNRMANRMAHFLLEQGVRRGDRVAVLSQNCLEMLTLLFACGKLGAIYVPYNWRLTVAELRPLVADTDPRIFFYGPHIEQAVAELQPPKPVGLLNLDLSGYPEETPPAPDLDPEDPWMILYTGGTTGRSKGAVLSHRAVLWNAWNTIAGWTLSPDDRVPILTPFFHTGGLNVFTTPLVELGGCSILMGPFDPGELLDAVEKERLTVIFMVPTMFKMVMDHPRFAETDFSRVRFLISGGAACPEPVLLAYRAKGCQFKIGYGLTEAGPNTFGMPDHRSWDKPGSVGFPLPHIQLRIVAEDGRLCGTNEVGELLIKGGHVFSGYWRNPEATAEALQGGWLHTGDLARRDEEGFYYIVDRKKDMIISGGENVFPLEVEDAIYQHPAVAECAVVGIPDPKWGEVGKAFVVLKPGMRLTEEELIEHCRKLLAKYKIPKQVEFLPELPKNAAGKILKRELK